VLSLWPWGDCWNGGGLFLSDKRYWLNAGFHQSLVAIVGSLRKKLTEESDYPVEESYGGECPGIYYIRLQRDGWKLLQPDSLTPHERVTVFEKELPHGWVLEMTAHATIHHPVGKGCYYDTHRIIHAKSGVIHDHPDWEWAEPDGERLVWVTKGVLYAALIHGEGLGDVKVLKDFNDMAFEAIEAPY
jgi:hypothetical protein